MPDMKAQWTRPHLVVLARAHPEENVLAGCKTLTDWGGAGYTNLACVAAMCNNCQRLGTS